MCVGGGVSTGVLENRRIESSGRILLILNNASEDQILLNNC